IERLQAIGRGKGGGVTEQDDMARVVKNERRARDATERVGRNGRGHAEFLSIAIRSRRARAPSMRQSRGSNVLEESAAPAMGPWDVCAIGWARKQRSSVRSPYAIPPARF